MSKRFDSLPVRLLLTYFFVMILTLTVIGYYTINTTNNFMLSEEKMNALKVASIVSSFAGDFITADNNSVSEGFDDFLETLYLDEKMRVMIVNKDSMAIYDSHNNHEILGKAQVRQSVITALGGKEGTDTYTDESSGFRVIDVSLPVASGGVTVGAVNVTFTADRIDMFSDMLVERFMFISLVSSILIGLIIFVIVNFITRRIVNFTEKIELMSDGVLDEKMEIKGNDEIARMGMAFNTMSEKLAALEKQRIQFVSDASHELKTPLSSIKLMSDSIVQNPTMPRGQIYEFLGDINNETDRLNRIINRLLNITRMDTDSTGGQVKTELLNLTGIVVDIVKTLYPLAQESKIDLSLKVEDNIYIMGDKDTLFQAIYNVCDNAIKYTKTYGKVEVILEQDGVNALIRVRDNGVGMSSEDIEHIFERFYRVDKARSRDTGGTGLGLAIADAAVKAHNGHIEVISELNMGSEFIIVLPRAEEN